MTGRVLIIAGEASGDLHGANLVQAMRQAAPGVSFFGVGGERMRAAGVDVVFDAKLVAVVGASEVLAHLGEILGVLRWIQSALLLLRPDLVILIDFPDFNFRVARAAKRAGVPIFYYISPQVWAWRRGRARFLARTVAGMAVIFPFEAELYRKWGLPAEFVGHPIMDGPLGTPPDRRQARERLGLDPSAGVVALLPGSRRSEIEHHLDPMVEAARRLAVRRPGTVFLLPVAPTLDRGLLAARAGPGIRLVDSSLDALASADAAAVKSGTSTVEAALSGVPFAVVYRLSPLTFAIGKRVVRVPFVAMANLIAGREVARELIQGDFTPQALAEELFSLLTDPARRAASLEGCAEVRRKMGGPGASGRAARLALSLLHPGRASGELGVAS